jgi:TfoX/Sxy family transcriptional regulator of competence genes
MDPKALKAILEQALALSPLSGELLFKPMFGGIYVYHEGRGFASLSDVGLAFKLATADQDELLKEPGAKRLQYAPDEPVSKQSVVVPESFLEDGVRLADWARRSAEFVATLPAKKK